MSDPFDLIGGVIDGKYRVDEVVGEGGFGIVYKGHHLDFDLPIAVKCLKVPAHFTSEARALFLEKFRDEGKHLAKLARGHSAITQVYAFGTVGDVPYLVLEWLDGEDLEAILARRREEGRPYAEREALELLRPAIEALALAHRQKVAHRDVKPANVFATRKPGGGTRLKLLDFGIAKAMQEGETATQIQTKTSSGFSAFSPSYGAPEQFRSKMYGATGPWTDVHALGLILVEMVCGRPPFVGEEMIDFYEQCAQEKRPTPRALGVAVSDAFEALCQRALARSPKDRFQSAAGLLEAVDALLEGSGEATKSGEISPTLPLAPDLAKAERVGSTSAGGPALQHEPVPRTEPMPAVGGAASGGSTAMKVLMVALVLGGIVGAALFFGMRGRGETIEVRGATARGRAETTDTAPPSSAERDVTPAPTREERRPAPSSQEGPPEPPPRPRPPVPPVQPEPSPPSETDGWGYINANSRPPSKAIIDGRPMGATPVMGVKVKPGSHSVVFRHAELGTRSTSVTVAAGQTKTVSVVFRK